MLKPNKEANKKRKNIVLYIAKYKFSTDGHGDIFGCELPC